MRSTAPILICFQLVFWSHDSQNRRHSFTSSTITTTWRKLMVDNQLFFSFFFSFLWKTKKQKSSLEFFHSPFQILLVCLIRILLFSFYWVFFDNWIFVCVKPYIYYIVVTSFSWRETIIDFCFRLDGSVRSVFIFRFN